MVREQKWRARLIGSVVLFGAWGFGFAGAVAFPYGPRHYGEGVALLSAAALALIAFYAWGAGWIRRMPSPSPGFARRLWALMIVLYPWLGLSVCLLLIPFLRGWNRIRTPALNLEPVFTIMLLGSLPLLAWMAVSLTKWRSALYDVAKGRRDEVGIS